jgi:hypothetical protein
VNCSAGPLAALTGVGRLAIGGAFLAAPVPAVRALGLDTASAKRVAFLARMVAGRDIVLGAGVLLTRDPRARSGWIAAGAAADAVDSVALGMALRDGSARGVTAFGVTFGAAGAAAVGFWAALRLRRS